MLLYCLQMNYRGLHPGDLMARKWLPLRPWWMLTTQPNTWWNLTRGSKDHHMFLMNDRTNLYDSQKERKITKMFLSGNHVRLFIMLDLSPHMEESPHIEKVSMTFTPCLVYFKHSIFLFDLIPRLISHILMRCASHWPCGHIFTSQDESLLFLYLHW